MRDRLWVWIIPCIVTLGVGNVIKEDMLLKEESLKLYYVVRKPKETTVQAPVLMLLHGYGSNEHDLLSLSSQIPDHWLVVSVRAPFTVSARQYKWYEVKQIDGKITVNMEDEEQSRKALIQCIDQIVQQYDADGSQVVVAGFSQGANMALGLALTAPEKILAAGCFSGRFMEEIKPLITSKKALKSKRIFIAHGTEDHMLPIKYAQENQATLQELGMNVILFTDKIAHSISTKEVKEFVKFLSDL